MINADFGITAGVRHKPGFNARSGFGQKTRKRKMEEKENEN